MRRQQLQRGRLPQSRACRQAGRVHRSTGNRNYSAESLLDRRFLFFIFEDVSSFVFMYATCGAGLILPPHNVVCCVAVLQPFPSHPVEHNLLLHTRHR